MLSKILSGATVGLDARLVDVEVDIPNEGLPSFTIVGLLTRLLKNQKKESGQQLKTLELIFQ